MCTKFVYLLKIRVQTVKINTYTFLTFATNISALFGSIQKHMYTNANTIQ